MIYSTPPKQRGWMFYASAALYISIMIIVIVLVPITMFSGEFFVIKNGSKYPELSGLFQKIVFRLEGICVYDVYNNYQCKLKNPLEMFYDMPSLSSYPKSINPSDMTTVLSSIDTQNPAVFIALVFSEILALSCLGQAVKNLKKNSVRRSIIIMAASTAGLLLLISICAGISGKIYGDIVPNMLNGQISVTVTQNGKPTVVTGKPSDIGITSSSGNGESYLGGLIALCCFAFFIGLRWIFEVKLDAPDTSDTTSSQIRVRHSYF